MSKIICVHLQKLVFPTCNQYYKRFLPSVCFGCDTTNKTLLNNKLNPCHLHKRFYSEKKDVTIQKGRGDNEVSVDVKTTIKEATKTVSYTGVILIGVAVTATLFYAVFRELFSGKSPSGIYSKAFKKCADDTRIQDALGLPVKGHGEETRRGRRRHVSHAKYEKDGVPHLRMVFYLKGSRNNASVHLDMRENTKGDLEYRYLFVQLDDYTRRVIILEDNRAIEDAAKSLRTPLDDFNSPLDLASS